MSELSDLNAEDIAAGIRARKFSACDVAQASLARVAERDATLNCFTAITRDRALAAAGAVDRAVAAGSDPGPLAGVPYAVKNLFDITGLPTLAGSKIRRSALPATEDAFLVKRMDRAGAVLIGALNMDEFAYGFTTENAHFGPTRNPHDSARVAGGSSGGSAAAVAGGLVPITLGSDTNGSIRVPASFCGVFGLKPTLGRLSRTGMFGFVDSFDHGGGFARTVHDLARTYDALQGSDSQDRAQAARPPDAVLPGLGRQIGDLRVGVLDDWFRAGATAEVLAAVDMVGEFLRAKRVTMPNADAARAAAFCITAAEGGNRHLKELKARAHDFDPATRDRLLAGALLPAAILLQAHRFRHWFRAKVAEIFTDYDVLIAPATPFRAPLIGEEMVTIGAESVIARAHIGLYTQPLSFIGLPVMAVPICTSAKLPIGVQVIAAPWAENKLFRVAAALEVAGIADSPIKSFTTYPRTQSHHLPPRTRDPGREAVLDAK